MQISTCYVPGGKHWEKDKLRKSARRNIESTFQNLQLNAFYSNHDYISLIALNILTFYYYLLIFHEQYSEVACTVILFYYLGYKHLMNVKQIIYVAKMSVTSSRP